MRSRILLALLLLAVGFAVSACWLVSPQSARSPISPVATPVSPVSQARQAGVPNLLANGGFDLPTHYEPLGEMGIVLPTSWKGWAVDEDGWLRLYQKSGVVRLGYYPQYVRGPRPGQDSKVLKPEILHICLVEPYLDPIRIYEYDCSVTLFKLYGHLFAGVLQSPKTIPGHTYVVSAVSHAWSRMSEDPNDAHYSHGVGLGAFYAEEGDPILNDSNDNFRFRLCVDPFGAENIFGSAVQCGPGAVIYNVFHSIPPITFTARADSATVFWSVDTRFGFVNSNAYADSFSVVDITAPSTPTPTPTATPVPTNTPTPTVTPGGPTATPIPGITLTCQLSITQRVYVLLPPSSGVEWYEAAIPVVAARGWSLGTSAVDACVNSCAHRTVIVVNANERGCNLYPTCRAPCGSLQYQPVAVESPADLAIALERWPEWLREAWGVCLPLIGVP